MRVLTNIIRTLAKKDDGSTIIEFAFVAPILATFLVAIVEFGMIMFSSILMESGLRDASRFGITGREVTGETRLESIVQIISDRTIGLIDMNTANVDVLVYPSFSATDSSVNFSKPSSVNTCKAASSICFCLPSYLRLLNF